MSFGLGPLLGGLTLGLALLSSIDDTTSVLACSTRDEAQNEEWVDAVVVRRQAPSEFP